MKATLLVLSLVLLSMPVYGFWSTGHMLIAQIAYDELQRMDPTYLKQIEKEIDVLSQYSMEQKHHFVESAVWADDNKAVQWAAFNEWHFVDTPVKADGWEGETEVEPMNATWAIYSMKRTLTNKNKPKFDSDLALSFAWRYLIHIVGDIHQPLHASTLYSDKFPHSDRGGNSFKVKYDDNKDITQLHALWDSCVDQYGSIWAPLNDTEADIIETVARNLTSVYTRDKVKKRVAITDYKKWAEESYEISRDYVYADIEYDSYPTPEYMASRRQVVDEQLVVAGYRLADMMVKLKHERYNGPVEYMLKDSE